MRDDKTCNMKNRIKTRNRTMKEVKFIFFAHNFQR